MNKKIMSKILIFFLLMAFHQLSLADVAKFKISKSILEAVNNYGEVWVNSENGEIYIDGNKHTSQCEVKNFTHIVKFDTAYNNKSINIKYHDAIFCKSDGVVIIIDSTDISYKTQFENIIKNGILDNGKFNKNIFYDPFNGSEWKMPSISAYVTNKNLTTDVYCAMKAEYTNNDHFWKTTNIHGDNDYTKHESSDFYNYEHTERQLLVNYMTDYAIEADSDNIKYEEDKILLHAGTKMHSLKGGSLFVWTKSNPCTSAIEANGGNCCVNWYREVKEILADNNNIYFFKLSNNSIPKDDYIRDKSVIEDIMARSKWLINSPKCKRLKKHNEIVNDILSDMAISYLECVGNVCDDVHDEVEAAFNANMPEGIQFIMTL